MKEYLFEFSMQRPEGRQGAHSTRTGPMPALTQSLRFTAASDEEAVGRAVREFQKVVALHLYRLEEVPLP